MFSQWVHQELPEPNAEIRVSMTLRNEKQNQCVLSPVKHCQKKCYILQSNEVNYPGVYSRAFHTRNEVGRANLVHLGQHSSWIRRQHTHLTVLYAKDLIMPRAQKRRYEKTHRIDNRSRADVLLMGLAMRPCALKAISNMK